jgi:Ca2+-transporting ATPase
VEDAVTILAVILAVSGVEVINELRAKRAVAALSSLSAPTATLLRGGEPVEVPASEVVLGDVALLGPGDRVPADLRLVEAAALRIDEASLTGESIPVTKNAEAVLSPAAELGDRRTMAYASTLVTAGKGRGVVVATGPAAELGRIAALVEEAREPRTPLQQAMGQLSAWLVWVAIGFSALVPALGVLVADRPIKEMLLVGLTLAFAHDLEVDGKGLGHIMNDSRMETYREIMWYGREHIDHLPEAFRPLTIDGFISRTYRVIAGGQPIMLIHEKFPSHINGTNC